jgi:hypothetical protein
MCFSNGGFIASSQWQLLMKYSRSFDGATSSTRNGMMATPLLTARSISRITWGDAFECFEKMTTITVLSPMASTMAELQVRPAPTSRGAIQQRILFASSVPQTASAIFLSSEQ